MPKMGGTADLSVPLLCCIQHGNGAFFYFPDIFRTFPGHSPDDAGEGLSTEIFEDYQKRAKKFYQDGLSEREAQGYV